MTHNFYWKDNDYLNLNIPKDENIVISIASYRDPELIPTIDNLFQKAHNMNRVFLGICLQDDKNNIDNFKYKKIILKLG